MWAHINIYCSKMEGVQRIPWWTRPGEDLLAPVFAFVQVTDFLVFKTKYTDAFLLFLLTLLKQAIALLLLVGSLGIHLTKCNKCDLEGD